MSYYYVKNGGTAIGDAGRYASQQTGSFATLGAANYYNDIGSALAATTTPVSGDFVNVSDLHLYSTAVTKTYTGVSVGVFYIVSVDDANIDNGRTASNRGSEISTGTSADIVINNAYLSGFAFSSDDNFTFLGDVGVNLYDCSLTVTGPTDLILISGDGSNVSLNLCEINLDDASSNIAINNGGVFRMSGGSVMSTDTGGNLFSAGFGNGGASVFVNSVDLSQIDGVIIANVGGSSSSDDSINVRFDLCKIATGVAFTNETFKSYSHRALFTRCSDSSVAAEYQYHLHAFGGDVDDDSAIFRNEDEAFTESNQKISYKIVTNGDASLGSPLWLDFPVLRYSELSAGATDTLRFYLTSDTALTDKDIYIEISYPDGTNKQTPNFLSSAPVTVGGTLDLMAAGTTLTTDATSTWTGGLTNKYQIDLNTSVDVGADCLPIVKVYITKPSITIQIASEFGLS